VIYECLIHQPSSTFCGARTREQSRSVQPWGTSEAVFESGEWRGVGGFAIVHVELIPGEIEHMVELTPAVAVFASQIDGALIGGA
jgi:hypothetical protein